MKVLDLFSGIGGFSVGLEKAGFETVAFCEIEEYPRGVLAKHWPDTPIYGDVRKLTGKQLRADGIVPDVIVGGYPCQPFSLAGVRRGEEDDRHLWPEVRRLVNEIRPAWCIFENVTGHISMGLDEVLSDLEAEDYAARPFVIPACGVDAPHRRDRVWIVAHAKSDRDSRNTGELSQSDEQTQEERPKKRFCQSFSASEVLPAMANARHEPRRGSISGGVRGNGTRQHAERKRSDEAAETARPSEASETLAYASAQRLHRPTEEQIHGVGNIPKQSKRGGKDIGSGWATEPNVGRVANGVPARSHRIKALGNTVVPQIPEIIGRIIMEVEANNERV